jgi:hypothetical protein
MPKPQELPQTPEQLLEEVFAIFPQYRARYTGPIHDDTPSLHSVLIGLSAGTVFATASEAQLLAFAALVNKRGQAMDTFVLRSWLTGCNCWD